MLRKNKPGSKQLSNMRTMSVFKCLEMHCLNIKIRFQIRIGKIAFFNFGVNDSW